MEIDFKRHVYKRVLLQTVFFLRLIFFRFVFSRQIEISNLSTFMNMLIQSQFNELSVKFSSHVYSNYL